ncbi:hypothetical protein MNBD_ALPHA06-963 [hydrothermal vent metagenome]|uniref:Uncharacterized protein n=1 Tax=hydrothermal vent metagenome TaxID=652676 RepID=A0A3B0R4J2_9ZZZZ
MNTYKLVAALTVIAGFCAPALAADGYRPQNDAQRNYKACTSDFMSQGVKLIRPFCGSLPSRPVFPDYEQARTSRLSLAELDSYAVKLHQFSQQVDHYQTCVNQRVMADGSLSNETLNYAACADQWAVDQKGKSAEEWTLSCFGQIDGEQKVFTDEEYHQRQQHCVNPAR